MGLFPKDEMSRSRMHRFEKNREDGAGKQEKLHVFFGLGIGSIKIIE